MQALAGVWVAALLAVVLARDTAVTIVVETPRDGRPHRVSVVGLDLPTLTGLSQAESAAAALAVFAGDAGPGSDRPAILGHHAVDEEGLHFLPRFPLVSGVRYTARFRAGRVMAQRIFAVRLPRAHRRSCRPSIPPRTRCRRTPCACTCISPGP